MAEPSHMGRDADSLSETWVRLCELTGPHTQDLEREPDPATEDHLKIENRACTNILDGWFRGGPDVVTQSKQVCVL